MLFLVHKNNIEISEDDFVNEGEVNVTVCHFSFDAEYGDLARKAIFTNVVQGLPYEVPITNDQCVIPGEVCNAEGAILVGVYAYEIKDDEVVLRYSPKPVKIPITEGSYVFETANPGKITPAQYEIYEAALNSALERLNQEIAKVDAALESGELNGPANVLSIGIVEEGPTAVATIIGNTPRQVLNLTLPKGETGETGPANTLSIGTVVSGSTAAATITGTAPDQTLNLVLPKGDTGPQGTTDFDDLENRPQYNGTTMNSATNIPEVVTYSAFTGTDGVDAGTAGLVPAPATTDAGKFLKADGTWDTAGGSSVTVVQTTGASTTDVMSQDAVSSMVFADPGTNDKIVIGTGASVSAQNYNMAIGTSASGNGTQSTAIGYSAKARPNGTALGYNAQGGTTSSQTNATAIGQSAYGGGDHCTAVGDNTNTINSYSTAVGASARARSERSVAIGASAIVDNSPAMAYSVALGANAITSRAGEVNVGTGASTVGYNSSTYRVIGGVYDGQDLHDAATLAQGNTLGAAAPDTSTVGVLGQLYTDTTNMHTYQCTAISGSVYTWTQRW